LQQNVTQKDHDQRAEHRAFRPADPADW